jgi:hypothetical protein
MSSVTSAGAPGEYPIAVAKLQLDAVEQQGKDAIALIESSVTPVGVANGPPANAAQGVGTQASYTA